MGNSEISTTIGEFQRHELFGVPYNAVSLKGLLHHIEDCIRHRRPQKYLELSAPFLSAIRKDPKFFQEINQFDFILPGGFGIILALKLLKLPVHDRVPAPQLADALIALSHQKGYRLYLLGATEEVNVKVVERVRREFPNAIIVGRHHGYFLDGEEQGIADLIRDSKADIVLVATPSPKKEKFINRWSCHTGAPVMLACGGYFDTVAGKTMRAPRWINRFGMEWFFRLIQEPRRLWRRILIGEFHFMVWLLKAMLFKSHFRSFSRVNGAWIANDAVIGKNTLILPGAVLGRMPISVKAQGRQVDQKNLPPLVIGDNCVIGSNAVIYRGTSIGDNCLLGDTACIREAVRIGDSSIIAMGVTINSNTTIGSRVKVMDNSHLTGNMIVEDDVFIGPLVATTNDNSIGRNSGSQRHPGPIIRRAAAVGGSACLLPNIEIGENSIVGASSIVTKSIPPHVLAMGSPCRVIRELRADEIKK